MVIMVRPSDGPAWTNPPTFATLNSQLNSASQNYYNHSHRQTWFGPKVQNGLDIDRLVVTPVLNLPGTTAQYQASFGQLQSDSLAAVRAQGGEWNGGRLDPNYFDRQVVMSNTKMISSTGLAYVGGRFSWVGTSLSGGVTEHEWGHNWGVYHANAWNVSSGQPARSLSGSNEEYKDGWDVMGGGGPTQGFNALFKQDLGFLERSRGEIVNITSSGTFRLYDHIHPHSRLNSGLVRALLIEQRPGITSQRVVLGFGHLPGTDGGLSRTDWNRNAVMVHSKLSSGSNRIDTTPFSRQTNDADDSSIKIGRTYSEGIEPGTPAASLQQFGGFHITPVARGSTTYGGVPHEWIDVVVHLENEVPGNNQPPTASFPSTLLAATPGQPFQLQVTAVDPDGDALAFDWDFGDDTYNLVSSATQTKTWPTAGIYLVSCTVSDMKGGTTKAQTWVKVGDVPFRNPENPPDTEGGLAFRYFEGVFNNLPNFANLLPVKTGTVNSFSLAPRDRNDNFAFLYEGFITVPTTDVYTFFLRSDDGSRLFIGDTLVVDNDGLKASPLETSGNIALNAGTHRIRLEFFHRDGAETLEVAWSTLSTPRAPVPAVALSQNGWVNNDAPSVTLTAPVDGDSVIVGSTVEIQAEAADESGIARVAFFAGNSYLGDDTSAPFSLTWENVAAGSYAITAVAYDTTGRFTISAPVTLQVTSPPIRDMIGINFVDRAGANGTLGFNQVAGAFFTQPFWNNAPQGTYGPNPAWNATVTNLMDQTGSASTAWTRYRSRTNTNYGDADSLADTSTANGRLLRGGLMVRNDDRNPEVEVHEIPYLEYDVYVYFDIRETNGGDIVATEFALTPFGEPTRPSIFGRNSRVTNDGVGDFPNYDTWVGFKESTAASRAALEAQQLGNYVVFRQVQSEGFHLTAIKRNPNPVTVSINAVQIVSRDPSAPRVALIKPPGGLSVVEGGASSSYAVVLAYPPTAVLTVQILPDSQVAVDRTNLTFTPENWDIPQTVLVTAVDDAVAEGPHTGIISHTVSASGNYAGLSAPSLSVAIADNEQAMVAVHANGLLREGQPGTASFVFSRSGIPSLAAPTTVSFQVSGTAAFSGDYSFSGASVSFNNTTGAGSVVIPAGQSQATLTVSAVNDNTRELTETVILTVVDTVSAAAGSPSSARLVIFDDDATDYFTDVFHTAANGGRLWNLNNRSITFNPSGNSYTVTSEEITAFPAGTSGFTNFDKTVMTSGTASAGWWSHNLAQNFPFFGTNRSQIFVSTEGVISFGTGISATASLSNHFGNTNPKIAVFWSNLDPGTAGQVAHRRIEDGGNSRTVIFYNGVRIWNTSTSISAQAELFDDGRIRLSYLTNSTGNVVTVVGLASGVTNNMPSSNYTETSTPRPFFPSDFTLYPSATTANRAPSFSTDPGLRGVVGQAYSYTIAAADPDPGATLTITAPVRPAWLTLTPNGNGTATLWGTPPATGSFPVTLQVSDGSLTANQSFTLLVTSVGGNTAPVFTSTPVTTALLGTSYTYAITTSDADGHAVSITALQRPTWLTLTDHGDGTATLSGTPPSGAMQFNTVTLLVSDGITSNVQTFGVTFQQPPVVTITRPLGGIVEMENLAQELDLAANVDPRGGPLSLQWSLVSGPGNVIFDTPAEAQTRVRFNAAGLHILRLTANNGFGSTTSEVYVFAGVGAGSVLGQGLQGYWQLDETSGPDFADASGNNRTLVAATASPTAGVPGFAGQALAFNGTQSQFARVNYAQPTAFTASAWIRAEAVPATGNRTIFSFLNSDTARARLVLPNNASRLRFFSNFNTPGEWRIEEDLPMQEWVHVAISYDRSSVNNHPVAYLNGRPVAVTRLSAPSGTNQNPDNFRVGCTNGSNTWVGRIDEVRLYNRILPATEIPLLAAVAPINAAPVITLGPDLDAVANQTVTLPGEVTDDGLPLVPGQLEILWSEESVPSPGSFGAPSLPESPYTTSSANGAHLLRLTADDGSARVSATITVSVTGATQPAPPSQPPVAPSALSATALSASQIGLTWTDNSDNETGFHIERDSGSGFALVHTAPANTTSWTDSGLAPSSTHSYRVLAVNTNGSSAATTPVTATTLSVLEEWQQDAFPGQTDPAIIGWDADPDGDGIPNLLEFALEGGNPGVPGSARLPEAAMVEMNDATHLTLTIQKNPAASGLQYIVEVSGDLTIWRSGEPHVSVVEETSGLLIVMDNTPITPATPRRFLRLRVETSP